MSINHYTFGLPAAARFFFTEDDGGGGGTATDSGNIGALDSFDPPPDESAMEKGRNQDRVEGEKPPDFSTLGKTKTPAQAAETVKAPEDAEKPAGGQPEKTAAPKKEAAKAPETTKKPAEEKKAAEKPADDKKKAPETPKAGEKAGEKQAKESKEEKILTDAEIDALQPRADAPKQVVENFKQMRQSMKTLAQQAREAQAAREALSKEVETLKATSGKLPPEVEERIKRADHFEMLFDAQNNPEFKKEYDGRIEQQAEGLFKHLEAYGLKPDVIKKIKDAAAANGGDPSAWPHWGALMNKFSDPIAKQEALAGFMAWREAVKAKTDRLNQLANDRQGYVAEMEKKDQAQKQQWAKELEAAAMTLGNDFEPSMEKEIPEGASPDVKKAIEAHNARVSEFAKEFKEYVLGAYNRDPKVIAEVAFANVKAKHYEKELTTVRAELETEKARRTELEDKLAKIKTAGRVAHVDTPDGGTPRVKTTVEEGKIGGDGAAALRGWFANK